MLSPLQSFPHPMLTLLVSFSEIMVSVENYCKSPAKSKFRETRTRRGADEEFGGKSSLKDFGYEFNASGELRSVVGGGRFVFDVKKGDRDYNQRHYEALGDVITEEVYDLLESVGGLKRIKIPVGFKKGDPTGFFFASEDYKTNERMLILIHGSGVVRAGQWSRKLIINESLNTGTQLPYIENAKKAGFSVVVMNTNQNRLEDEKGKEYYIPENEDPVSHAFHVWEYFIVPSKAKHIAIVAHSAGGYVTVKLATQKTKEFISRVFSVAFTDSAHSSASPDSAGWKHMLKVAQNWVTSRYPLDSDLQQYRNEVVRVSAGTTSHEETSSRAIDSVCAYIKAKLLEATKEPVVSSEVQDDDDDVTVVTEEPQSASARKRRATDDEKSAEEVVVFSTEVDAQIFLKNGANNLSNGDHSVNEVNEKSGNEENEKQTENVQQPAIKKKKWEQEETGGNDENSQKEENQKDLQVKDVTENNHEKRDVENDNAVKSLEKKEL